MTPQILKKALFFDQSSNQILQDSNAFIHYQHLNLLTILIQTIYQDNYPIKDYKCILGFNICLNLCLEIHRQKLYKTLFQTSLKILVATQKNT